MKRILISVVTVTALVVGGLFTVRRHRLTSDQLELTPAVVRD
jgi:uncharacterized protein YxeA